MCRVSVVFHRCGVFQTNRLVWVRANSHESCIYVDFWCDLVREYEICSRFEVFRFLGFIYPFFANDTYTECSVSVILHKSSTFIHILSLSHAHSLTHLLGLDFLLILFFLSLTLSLYLSLTHTLNRINSRSVSRISLTVIVY